MKSLRLGRTTNLLYGLDASWLSETTGNDALLAVKEKSLEEKVVEAPEQAGTWGFPEISLHDSAIALLNALLPYKTEDPSDGTHTPDLPPGALLLAGPDSVHAVKTISDTLGVDLSCKGCGFALIQVRRTDAYRAHAANQQHVLVHPNPAKIPADFGVKKSFLKTTASLKRVKPRGSAFDPAVVNTDDANKYLAFFEKQGSHFVSGITLGDVIFQVLAMPTERFQKVKKIYSTISDKLSGAQAMLFRQYTTDHNTGMFGYVRQYGKILNFTQSKTLADSVQSGDWKENTFALTDSIFALYQDNSRITTEILNRNYQEYTSISTELTSLTLFLEHSKKQVWRRVFNGGLIQIFQKAIAPRFVKHCQYDLADRLSQNEIAGFLSNIATPEINTYKTALDLSTLDFVAPQEVKTFTLYSNYLYNTQNKTIKIPGNNVLMSLQMASLEDQEHIATLELTDKAFDSFVLACQSFYGALYITNASGSACCTIVDGLKYSTFARGTDGRKYVHVTENIRKVPAPTYLPRLKSSLQFNYSFSEASLNTFSYENNGSGTLKDFLQKSLVWISQVIPAETSDVDLLDLRVRALNQAHVGKGQSMGSFVPILPYTEYQTYIDRILDYITEIDKTIDSYQERIEVRKTQELIVEVAQELNKNIIDSGKLISGYIDTSISQQKSLTQYYDSIIKQKQIELNKQTETVRSLWSELNKQQSEVATAVANYQQAIKDWKITETIKFGLTVATDLFSLGVAIAVPASSISAVKDLGLLVQRIQKLLNILNSTYKMFENTKTNIEKIRDAQTTFNGISDVLTADVSWDELSIKLDEVLSTGPSSSDVNAKKAALLAAFKVYALRGKAYTSAQSSAQQIAGEIYNQQRQQDLTKEQTERLAELDTHLNPAQITELDKSKIDLVGLTGSLSMIRSQMLGMLSKAFMLKDESLQYVNLQAPTVIASFDTLGIKSALVTQEGNRITAIEELSRYQSSVTTPIDVEIEVPVQDLRNGGVYQFNLQPNMPEFFEYVDVRVKAVVARIDGIKSTDSHDYLVSLGYSGKPFVDRGVNRDTILFNTVSRSRIYEYEVQDNKPKFTDNGATWSEDVNPITPFSIWEISLPATKKNKGIVFEGLTAKITLTFILKARIHDEKKMLLRSNRMRMASANMLAIKPAIGTLLNQMAGKSVLNNWDVVFNMGLANINDVLKAQYDELKDNDQQYGGIISVDTDVQGASIGDILVYNLQKFDMTYGYPKLSFLVNEGNTGNMEMQITSGKVQKGNRYEGNDNDLDRTLLNALAQAAGLKPDAVKKKTMPTGEVKLVLEYYTEATQLQSPAHLQAVIKISQVKGVVDNNQQILSVCLNMSEGTFAANNIEIDMSDEQKIAFSDAVKAYFVKHPVCFIINSLDLTGIATLPDLKPHQFLFKVLRTQGGSDILQLFIQTNNRDAFSYSQTYISTETPEPIPEGSDASLMINSRILFGGVLPSSLLNGWAFAGTDPQSTTKAWSGKFSSASVQASVDLSSLNRSDYTGSEYSTTISEYTYEPSGGNPVTWSINGMGIQAGANANHGEMTLSYNQKNTFNYVEKVDTTTTSMFTTHTYHSEHSYSTDITLNITAAMPLTVKGTGRKQDIQINVSNTGVSVDARTSGGGPCGTTDLQAKVNQQLRDNLPSQIVSKMNVSFSSVSVFALNNLLFPSKNYINLQNAYTPGDLLVVGNFVTQK